MTLLEDGYGFSSESDQVIKTPNAIVDVHQFSLHTL